MASPIGLSLGDIAKGIELAVKAARALKQSGGAFDQYHQTILDLQAIGDVIRRVQGLQPTSDNVDRVEKMKKLAHACNIPLSKFRDEIAKFEKHFNILIQAHSSPKEWASKTGRKLQWTIGMEKQLEKLRAAIGPQMLALDALLQFEDLQNTAGLKVDVERGFEVVDEVVRKADALTDLVRNNVATREQASFLSAALAQSKEAQSATLSTQKECHSGLQVILNNTTALKGKIDDTHDIAFQTLQKVGDIEDRALSERTIRNLIDDVTIATEGLNEEQKPYGLHKRRTAPRCWKSFTA